MKLNADTVCQAIRFSWAAAHKAPDHGMWLYHWRSVSDELDGMWSLMLFAGEDDELREDIALLRGIADEIKMSWVRYREAA